MTQNAAAFTARAEGYPKTLVTPCAIAPSGEERFDEFVAIWDTGATNTLITQAVVDRCGLRPMGPAFIGHAGLAEEPEETESYLIAIRILDLITVNEVPVLRGGYSGADVLIGMDIINTGDFAITHRNGNTKFTFRVPSIADIDFVQEENSSQPTTRQQRRARQRGNA